MGKCQQEIKTYLNENKNTHSRGNVGILKYEIHSMKFEFFLFCDLKAEGVVSGVRFYWLVKRDKAWERICVLPIPLSFLEFSEVSLYEMNDGSMSISNNDFIVMTLSLVKVTGRMHP